MSRIIRGVGNRPFSAGVNRRPGHSGNSSGCWEEQTGVARPTSASSVRRPPSLGVSGASMVGDVESSQVVCDRAGGIRLSRSAVFLGGGDDEKAENIATAGSFQFSFSFYARRFEKQSALGEA